MLQARHTNIRLQKSLKNHEVSTSEVEQHLEDTYRNAIDANNLNNASDDRK